MKVTLVGPVYPYRGGIAHYTTHLALALKSSGHACDVISFRRQYPARLYPGGSDKDPSQSALKVPADYLLDPLYPWTWRASGQHILQQNPDLVVLQWWTTWWTLPFAYLARWFQHKHVPLVYIIHNVLPHEEKFWDRPLVKLALSRAAGFVVQTQRENERLKSLYPRARSEIVAHPAYTMLTSQRIDKSEARKRLGFQLEQPLILFFGFVRPYKGLKYLIEAVSLLKTEGLTLNLLVAGDFWEDRNMYDEQIKVAGLSDHVRLDDRYIPDEDAAVMFSAADAFVAPYTGGTQSGVAGIALSYGLPMIVTEQIAAGLSDNNPAFVSVVPPADARALANAIRELVVDPSNESGIQPDVQEDWERLVSALVALHKQITEGP